MKKSTFILLLAIITSNAIGQVERSSELFKTILVQDSLLFNIGFNTCDISQFDKILSENFEFTHDLDSISNKKKFIQTLRENLCASPNSYQSRRELLTESSEVFPLYKGKKLYGALQTGRHRFYETTAGQKETYASSARFTHIWTIEKGEWKLSKGISYDHQETDIANFISPNFDNELEIEKWLQELNVPSVGIGYISNGKLTEVKVYGEIAPGTTAPYNTIFNVASLTKPVTAIVTLKLVSEGKWNLDEPICNYWTDPDVINEAFAKKLTTRHILSHQTGFSNWRGNNEDGKLHFEFEPGTKYQYSGEGFEYLRIAIEKKFNKSLDQLAHELIFDPLQMSDTEFVWTPSTDSTRFAVGYNSEGVPYDVVKNKFANAADNLITTVEDYSIFLTSIMSGMDLTEQVKSEMISHQVSTKKNKYFGLGFEIYDFGNGEYAISHGGSDEGCQTIVFMIPSTQQGIVIFTNADNGYLVYEKILLHYLGENGQKIIDIETK